MHAAATAAVGGSAAARVVSSATRLMRAAAPCQRVCTRDATTMGSASLRMAPRYAVAPSSAIAAGASPSASASASGASVPRRWLSTALPQVGAPLRRKVTTVDLIAMKKRKHKISSQKHGQHQANQ